MLEEQQRACVLQTQLQQSGTAQIAAPGPGPEQDPNRRNKVSQYFGNDPSSGNTTVQSGRGPTLLEDLDAGNKLKFQGNPRHPTPTSVNTSRPRLVSQLSFDDEKNQDRKLCEARMTAQMTHMQSLSRGDPIRSHSSGFR